jgi:hypothetical protein
VLDTQTQVQPITFSMVEDIVSRDKERPRAMRLVRKLNTRVHLRPKGSDVMKVKRAAQILSNSMAEALQRERTDEYRTRLKQCYTQRREAALHGRAFELPYSRTEVLDARHTSQLQEYCEKTDRWLNIMNSRVPVLSPSDPRLDELIAIASWFREWWNEIESRPSLSATERNSRFVTHKVYHDLVFTCHAFVAHCKDYLRKWPDSMVFPVG